MGILPSSHELVAACPSSGLVDGTEEVAAKQGGTHGFCGAGVRLYCPACWVKVSPTSSQQGQVVSVASLLGTWKELGMTTQVWAAK